jgi:hypothetical protein
MELRAFADGVTQTLGVARGLVEAGRCVDLAGLEDQVGLLCAKALDLPPAEGRSMLAELVATLARVEALSVALLRARNLPDDGPQAGEMPDPEMTDPGMTDAGMTDAEMPARGKLTRGKLD